VSVCVCVCLFVPVRGIPYLWRIDICVLSLKMWAQIWTSHVTNMNGSCHIYEQVMSHIWMSHVTHTLWHNCNQHNCCVYLSHDSFVTHSHVWHDWSTTRPCPLLGASVGTRWDSLGFMGVCIGVWTHGCGWGFIGVCLILWIMYHYVRASPADLPLGSWYLTKTHITHKSIWINQSSVNPKSTSNQSSKPCTVLQYPSRKGELVPDWYQTFPPDHIDQAEINDSTMLRNKTSTA